MLTFYISDLYKKKETTVHFLAEDASVHYLSSGKCFICHVPTYFKFCLFKQYLALFKHKCQVNSKFLITPMI